MIGHRHRSAMTHPNESVADAATGRPNGPPVAHQVDPGKPLCRTIDLHLSYGKQRVLDGCDLAVAAGQVVGLTGENGSGKSSLVKCLLGFLRPSAGEVECDPRVGYCPQENYLHRSYTVAEHLALVSSLHRGGMTVDPAYLERCLGTLKLTPYLHFPIRKLSGGTYQKVKLLTAIVHRPPLLLLDEPTDGFDWTMYLVFWRLLAELVAAGTGVLMISHLLHDRERFDRIHDLHDGKLHA
jgi:ABC-type multidrug transport system ATPase subunit